jgi:hypothetical protein
VLAHVESEHALSVSFLVFSMSFVVSLLGGVVYVFYRPHQEEAKVIG